MKRLPLDQNMLWASTKIKPIFVFALLITLSVFCFATQTQAGPPPIQTFFVPLPERQVETSLEAVDTGTDEIGDVMSSMVSIVATGDSTIIYYDHWEDGYELDLANPVQASTRIWGDNDPANGMPPGFATDLIDAGDVISLENDVSLPRDPSEIRYDGRDKFGGTRAVAVTRASWAVDPGVVLAGAVEVYPLRDYGLQFEVPVGEDIDSDQMFQYTSLFVLAAEDGTDIQIDIDGNGSTDISLTLNQGESYQVDGGIDTGASVTAAKPVQAHIFTGDVGARFESRFYTLYPVENWSDSYYSPVGTAANGDETYVFLYNPNGSAITVNYDTRIGSGSFVVAAGGSYRYLMPSESGAHFFTSDGSTFFAIATVGAEPGANQVHDWGFSLLPENYLTPMAVVGWGPGSNDLTENGSPVWVTAAAATTVHVDYDGDPATGLLTDANGDHYDVDVNLAMLESARVYDNNDNDQTGMKLYTQDGTLITAAWGQDPATSGGGSPYLDLGTTVLPFPIASVEKTSAHVVDDNSNGLIDWGDTIEYTITVNNDGVIVLGGVVAFDPLPTGSTYVLGSTTLNGVPVADEIAPATPYPLDEGGISMPVIPPTEFSTITFRVTVDFGTTTINNSVSIDTDQEVLTTDDTIDVNTPDVTACNLDFTDAGGASQATYLENSDIYVTVDDNDQNTDSGSAQSFTVVVVNPDSGDTETITLIETGNDTGVFRNTAALPSSFTGGMSDEDGTLHAVAGNTVQVAYTDPLFGDTCSDTAGIIVPTEIKPLYLSEPGQGMDRVDPVATVDGTTATSVELSYSGSGRTDMAVWSASGIPEYNVWDGDNFGTTQNAVSQATRWRTMAGAAAPTRHEKIVVGIENGGEISGELWNGSSWSTGNLTSLDFVNETYWWGADVAYEQQSGDAVLVWNGGNTSAGQLRYKVWNGSTWTAAASIGAYAGGEPQDMHMAAKPGADEMVLVVNDINADDYTLVWNGSTWGNALSLDTSGTAESDQSALYVAYEQQSGRALVVYGKDGDANGYYRIWNGSGWEPGEGTITAPTGVSSQIGWIRLASDPQSNRIVLGVLTNGGTAADIWLNVWDGSSWGTSILAETTATGSIFPNVAVAFESQSGQALAVYGQNGQNVVRYRTWSSAGGWSGEQTDGPNIGAVSNTMTLDSDPLSDGIMLSVQDFTSNLNYVWWNGLSWLTLTELETNTQETKNQPFVFLYDQQATPPSSSTTFTQTPAMCKDFVMPAGGAVDAEVYVNVTSGTMPANPDITATIKHDGTTIEILTNPAVTDLGAGVYQLDWTDVISSDTTVLAGEQVELEIATTEPGVSFEILYDSSTYPSKILLPTTTVIVIHVDTLAAYDAPYPGGSPVTDAQNGATLYLRATVSDPFGTDDITDLDLSISDPCGGGPINVILDDGDVVATAGCSKTYEYVWNTTMCQGNYDIVTVANEGTEGITDSAAIRVTLSFTDTGTAGITAFTDAAGNPVDNYDADTQVCLQVTDMDQNTNPAVAETLTAVVTSAQGDSETLTLTETDVDTGIFRACIALSATPPAVPENGSLHALPGDVLVASYTDPDDASDTSDDTALVNIPSPDMTLAKRFIDPADGTALVNDMIRFDIVVGSPGPTDLTSFTVTDTFDAACLSYDAANIAPESVVGNEITWSEAELGTLPVGSSVIISIWFTADAACAPATNSVLADGLDENNIAVSAGPADAQVTITQPELSVTKTLISPNPGPAYVGDPVTFRITLNNTGTSEISTLPLADTFSAACYDFDSAVQSGTGIPAPPDGIGAGSLLWDNLGPLGVSASTSLDVTLTVTGECNPAQNTADVSFAVDENGDSLPPVQDSAGLQTIGARIGDRVWNDRNGNGAQDAGEGGIASVIVFVDLNADNNRDAGEPYDTTDVTGAYDITDLAAGSYTVWVDATTIPAGATLTGGSNPLAVTVADGEDFNTADFGYRGNASIGDFIWHDTDGDGNQDGGEPGLANVTVFLDMDSDGVLDAGEPFSVTAGSGNYDFTNLVAGNYLVDVDDTTLPPNYFLTTGAASLAVTLAAGEDQNNADFGYRQLAGVNGHLYDDVDGDGVQDAGEADLAGIDVIITDSNGDQQTVTTDADGDYQAYLPPGATTLDVDDTTLPPNAFITTANDPQTVTVNAGAFTDSSDVGYQFGIASRMKMRTGYYTGNGIAGTPITGLGFEPNLVIIKVADDTKEGVMRTSSMIADNSKPMGDATALEMDLIQSLDTDGFTIGADDRVNKDTFTYHWIAFEAGDGEMTVDSYTGTGADNTSVTGVGFQPDYVMVLPAINKEPVHRSSAQTGDTTLFFKNSASTDNHIQALQADGFQVGDDDRVNKINETYHYIAWKEVAGKMAVDSYDGNATDGTEISGLGFEPEYVIIKQDNAKEAVHRPDSLGGDNTLWFKNESQSADMIQELQSDGFQIGLDDNVNASSETYFWAAFAGSHLTISSAADQAFYVNDPATVIQTITITEDNLDPTITAANDIRIRIPAGFNMTWDTSVATASIGGMAAAKVSAAVTYEDGDRTLVLDVTGDFAASDQVTVSLLRFNNFTAGSPADNLELEVDDGDTVAAVDDKTIAVVAPTISSAADQYFIVGSPAKAIRTITITEDSIGPSITAANDIRIRIPAGFNMTWDTSVATATIGGSAAGKVLAAVLYEDDGRTLVIDATSNFAASDQITISDLSFTDFSDVSLPDNLELEVKDDGMTTATDDRTIAIGRITISSVGNQEFYVGGPDTAIATITITEDSSSAVITADNDIRIRIPDNFYMLWDITAITPVFGGTAASKVSNTVSYEDSGKTLVLNVDTDFAASDQITISGLSFTNFTAASSGDHLELEVFNDGETTAEDDKFKAIGGTPSAGSMLVYGEGSEIEPRYRTWDGANFSIEALANNTDDTIKWVVLKPSPIEYEMVLATYSSADKNLYVQTWDGSNWTSNWNTDLDYDGSTRMFDIAYENNSGDVVVVFGDNNDNTLKYRKRVNGTWDGADQLLMTPDNQVNWVRAESRPGSDDIFVATVASSKSLYAMRWDGTGNSWGDQIKTTAGVFNAGTEGFDIAFGSASGDAVLVWGDAAKNVMYKEFTTGWQAETRAYSSLPDDVRWLAAAYDPQATGSEIAIAMVLDNNTFEFGAWDGSSWVGRPAAMVAPNKDNRFIDVAFESNTGEAVYGFSQNANADGDPAEDDRMKLSWRTWTSSGGFSSVMVEAGLSGEIKFVQLKADPLSDDIMAVYADKDKDLYHRFWDGSTWTPLAAPLETELSDEDKNEAFMFTWLASPPTAVNLLSFTATGQDESVLVSWETAHEINNMGFYLYRSHNSNGPFIKLTDKLIPGSDFTTIGQHYEYIDQDVTRGQIYYYRLVDVETSGKLTDHGPICVDWDADGMADDWEIANALDPTVNDADLDADNDGLSNLEEYERGSDPNNPDSDGDGILDGDEHFQYGPTDAGGSLSLSRGVYVLASDETGITLELRTEAFETATVEVGAGQFEKLSIKEYVHGYTTEVGKPRLPLKGIMLDLPAGQSAHLTVLDSASTIGYGYRVFPVPQNFAEDLSYSVQVAELFTMDADAYGQDVFYPASVAGLGEVYNFREQLKQQLIFYPLSFNPVSGQVRHYSRIRVRIDYEDADLAKTSTSGPQPWVPPSGNKLLNNPIPTGPTAMAFIGPAFLNSPIISAIASLGTLAQAVWMPPAFDWTTQGPAFKILVAEAGIYRLTGIYLDTSGVDLAGVNIGQVRLYNLGTEIALTVYDENGNNGFDGSDYIEFYATAVDSGYAKYTNHNVYWLTLAGGIGAPLRMEVVNGAPGTGPDTDTHDFTVHYEPDQGYWQEAPGPDSLDRWFIGAIALGDQINSVNAGQPVSFNLPIVDVVDDETLTGTLKILMYGGYDTDHEVRVSYEGEDLGTFAWSGYTNYEVVIEGVDFREQTGDGNFTVSVTCLSGFDRIAFDWIAATYPREFVASNDSLGFTHDPGYLFTIDDFSTAELMVLDITAADDPMRVEGFDIFEPVPSSFSLEFETTYDGQAHTYLVLAETEVQTTPAAVVEDSASDLGDTANGADYILITHQDIGWDGSGGAYQWIDDFVALRQAQGLRVKVVNVQDIYDEFSYGLVTPQAIKDFLTYAYENWAAPAPQYVVLVGDSSYDFKDNWGYGTINYVPAYLTYTEYMGETVTDEWFVTVTGDDAVADMFIGRLPAQSAAEAQVMVAKIIAYETAPNTKTWEKNTLLVADDQEEAFEIVFKTMNEDAAALLPTGMDPPYKGYLQDYLDAGFSRMDLNNDILDQINAGALIANFSGHGYLRGWASPSIFDAGDIDSLTNAGKYPFIVSMNCLTGYFAYPDPNPLAVSFAELLLRAEEKGTAAALMPTGMTTTAGQHVMNTALFETIFVEDVRRLGPAIARAKRELLANGDAYFEQVSQTFLLFGDPAMQLRVPLPRRPSGLAPALWTKTGVALRWDAALDCNNNPVVGYNVYRGTSPTGNFAKINTVAITEEEYTDNTASAAAAAATTIYYYTVTAVDTDGDESISSAMAASPNLAAGAAIVSGGSGGGGGGCFVSAAANSFKLADIRNSAIYWILMVCGFLLPFVKIVLAHIAADRLAPRKTRPSHGLSPVRE